MIYLPRNTPFWQKNSLVTVILFELCLLWYLAQSQIHRITLYKRYSRIFCHNSIHITLSTPLHFAKWWTVWLKIFYRKPYCHVHARCCSIQSYVIYYVVYTIKGRRKVLKSTNVVGIIGLLVGIGLANLQKSGEGQSPPLPQVPTVLQIHCSNPCPSGIHKSQLGVQIPKRFWPNVHHITTTCPPRIFGPSYGPVQYIVATRAHPP